MSQLETAMAILMNTFDTYAGADGKPDSLSKKEVKALMEKELPGLLQVNLKQHTWTCSTKWAHSGGEVVIKRSPPSSVMCTLCCWTTEINVCFSWLFRERRTKRKWISCWKRSTSTVTTRSTSMSLWCWSDSSHAHVTTAVARDKWANYSKDLWLTVSLSTE